MALLNLTVVRPFNLLKFGGSCNGFPIFLIDLSLFLKILDQVGDHGANNGFYIVSPVLRKCLS